MLEAHKIYAAMGQQPLFKYAVRRVRWAGTDAQLRRYNRRAVAVIHLLIAGFWFFMLYSSAIAHTYGSGYYGTPYYVYEQSGNFIIWLVLISIGMDVILDFACLVFALNSIGGEISAGRWDLLRMTPIIEERIVEAKHNLAQVRAWRVLALVLGARAAAVVLMLVHILLLPVLIGGPSLADMFGHDFLNPLLGLVTLAIFLGVYVIEPLWRMRAMTAVGIAISARVYNVVYALLAAFAGMVAVWISQAIIMGIIGWFTVQFAAGLFLLCGVLGACIATAYIVRVYYVTVERWALDYATRRIYEAASR